MSPQVAVAHSLDAKPATNGAAMSVESKGYQVGLSFFCGLNMCLGGGKVMYARQEESLASSCWGRCSHWASGQHGLLRAASSALPGALPAVA